MFDPSARPRLFALPCGADFPAALVDGMIARMAGQPPEAMARVTLYLNTHRMLRRVREVFGARGARLLPRLRLVTDLGRDPLAGLPPAIPPLRRRLELAQLVAVLVARQPDFAPGTATYDLADSLATLMDEMQGEGVDPAALERLDIADHAAHWQRALAFIRIVARYFDGSEAPDPEARQRKVAEALVQAWAEAPPSGPVIAAGSTGSRGATSLFLQAVARLPQGAVVLPGFDFDLPEAVWTALDDGIFPAEDHPQYRFWTLTRALDLTPRDVARWSEAQAPSDARNRLVSLALRPAPVTDQWLTEGARLADLAGATAGLTLIEAPNPRTEALAIALRLRQAAEDGTRAALVTPDRLLGRRVAAALDRWGILADESAGQPLVLSPPGRFLRHVAALVGQKLTVEALLTLLKHPLTCTGGDTRGPHLLFTRELELHLRRHGPAFPGAADLAKWAAKGPEDGREAWTQWLGETLCGLEALTGERPLLACIETLLVRAEALAAGPGGSPKPLWAEAAGREAARIMGELQREAPHGGSFTPHDFADLLATLLQAGSVRTPDAPHPLIAIWGTLEARVQGADLVILGGLTDGVWPELPPPDPWLSRKMRAEAGLLLPERRVGLAAHDFQQAVAARDVVLSRALRDAEAETVPSRWLNRLTNLLNGLAAQGGPQALAAMQARGAALIADALRLEAPEAPAPRAHRPAPRPPLAHRPRELAVTGIRTLIRDPYAIYARHILRLRPLDPIGAAPDARLRGQALHLIVERFIRQRPAGETPEAAAARLLAVADAVLTEEIPWPSARRLWRARLARVAPRFLAAEAGRAARGAPMLIEKTGSVTLQTLGFTLTARPDRIDLLEDGRVHIYDYKTGEPPSLKMQEHFEKQLLLEAAMAERGAFAALGPREVEAVTYIGLGTGAKLVTNPLEDDILGKTWSGLHRLIGGYLLEGRGYTARRAMFEQRDVSDYDHLSRYGEWELNEAATPERVGPEEAS
ncbi:double-strand break repair protein AddB [Frigidibacter albus]|uniref:Double-strand break repair protein AddB n=1 Tax=Frigidibacter albus TaxID=1465486 RepID=A0A6L8VGK9_9RHOB|nr:double-strand break repair protein AddB [Frigidibacter albus]MZQ89518.1 double-strand break repair protein AddB [Frigidibacter albus]NBE31424.1 double-strand break repair protein AddB [Frigidibacter albus]GGH55531.1 double-strand break repair protein AddB [Frigidibacter albus]